MMNHRLLLCLAAAALAGCQDPTAGGPSARPYKAVATGGDHSCAVSEDGAAYCWGAGNEGELGTGAKEVRFTPARVVGNIVFDQITAGDNHTCALDTTGKAYCWGWNVYFQRGNSSDTRDSEPVAVSTAVRFRGISAGAHHTCALSLDSLAYCWGYNRSGQIGDGLTVTPIAPRLVVGGNKFGQLSSGAFHTCAVTATGALYCWGSNEFGQLGIGSSALSSSVPLPANTTVRFLQVDGGVSHTCGVALDQKAYCWGSNEYGELGDGGVFKSGLAGASVPQPVSPLLPSGLSISAGASHTCAISLNGTGFCWGRGGFGQLADGSTEDSYHPQPINLLAAAITITKFATGGTRHACALVDRSVFCWGDGRAGQLGVAGSTFTTLPERVGD